MITGGTGFVGSHLAESLLNQKNDLLLISKTDAKKDNIKKFHDKTVHKKADITDFKKIGKIIDNFKPDMIVHLAGTTSHSKSFEMPLEDVDSNAKSTLFLLEKIRHTNPKCKFILGSTFIVIGRPKKLPVNENTPCNPTTLYGANRLASENYCKIYHDVYDLDTRIFRITNSYGPREQTIPNKNAVNYLIYKAYNKEEITIFHKGKFFRDLVFISDVISGIQSIIKKGKMGNLYWISSGQKTWFYQFGNVLHDLTNAPVKYVMTPTYTKKVDVGNFVVDNSKLRSLGWSPKISLKKGVQITLDYFTNTLRK
jgi:UDP-glucose 4-epimerase